MSNNRVKLPNHLQKRVKSIATPVLAPPAKNLQYSQEKSRDNSQDTVLSLEFSSQVTTSQVTAAQGATQSSISSYKTCHRTNVKNTPPSEKDEEGYEE